MEKETIVDYKTEYQRLVVKLDELSSGMDEFNVVYCKNRLITTCKDYFSDVDFPGTVSKLTGLLNDCFNESNDVGYTPQELGNITHSVTNVISFLTSINDEVNYLKKIDALTEQSLKHKS